MSLAAVVDHLWQSTLAVLLAWGLTTLLRPNHARVRFWVWFAASVKFLVPISWLSISGTQLGGRDASAGVMSTLDLSSVAMPLLAPATTSGASAALGDGIMTALLTLWLSGTALLLARWSMRWRESVRLAALATPSTMRAPVPVRVTSAMREPGVVGIFQPVLLLPHEIAEALRPEELAAILEHELCHVRRRDNLWASVHMLVEAIFWFHPAVWWLGARLVEERERACDEAVLASGANPRGYAQGILKVCQFYMASKLACVAGVSGANLKIRLEGIMKNQKAVDLTPGRKWLLGAVALSALMVPQFMNVSAASPAAATSTATAAGKIVLLADRRVKLDYENVDVRSLLQALAQAAKVNMLVSDQVSGSVTVRLDAMPWEQALDTVLASQGLQRHESAGIIIVEPRAANTR